MSTNWFNVDKAGLSAILERRGKSFALAELVSNAWDSGSDRVDVSLEPVPGAPFAQVEVEDYGDGFQNLDHAYTMFARSSRADQPTKRGRFNLGEKLVLAICREAEIVSTSGGIRFDASGKHRTSKIREQGTLFRAELRMSRDELAEAVEFMGRMIPPVTTIINGTELHRPDAVALFSVKLPTEVVDDDGHLRRTMRVGMVEVFEAEDGHGELLELGIPVVEVDMPYRINVLQKIPLNMERDNATPSLLSAVRVAVLNHLHDTITPEQAAAPWAQEASGDARATADAVRTVITKRFGDRAVIATPGDPLANAQAEAAGFTVIPGGALSADTWANVRKAQILMSSSRAFPSPTPEQFADMAHTKCPLCGK